MAKFYDPKSSAGSRCSRPLRPDARQSWSTIAKVVIDFPRARRQRAYRLCCGTRRCGFTRSTFRMHQASGPGGRARLVPPASATGRVQHRCPVTATFSFGADPLARERYFTAAQGSHPSTSRRHPHARRSPDRAAPRRTRALVCASAGRARQIIQIQAASGSKTFQRRGSPRCHARRKQRRLPGMLGGSHENRQRSSNAWVDSTLATIVTREHGMAKAGRRGATSTRCGSR